MATSSVQNHGNLKNPAIAAVWQQEFWQPSAPSSIIEAVTSGNQESSKQQEIVETWLAHLSNRNLPLVSDLIPSAEASPLYWCLPEEQLDPTTVSLISVLQQFFTVFEKKPEDSTVPSIQNLALIWLSETEDRQDSLDTAYQALAWARSLVLLAQHLPQETWWSLFIHLAQIAKDSAALKLSDCPLTHQLLTGELRLTLAYSFPEVKVTETYFDAAGEALSTGLVELLDGRGMPNFCDLNHFRPLMACWVRSLVIGKAMDRELLQADASEQFHWTVTSFLRLLRSDGTQMLTNGSSGRREPDLLNLLLVQGGNKDDYQVAEILSPVVDKIKEKSMKKVGRLKPAYQSQWSGIAIMRPKWQQAGLRMAVGYGDQFSLELNSDQDMVLCDEWKTSISIDGNPLQQVGRWEQICWTSDRDVDYLELEADFENGCVVQRHIMLARKDRLLFLADAIVAGESNKNSPRKIEYQCQIPLGSDIQFETVAETRECYLMGSGSRGMILPLALNEWRTDTRCGELQGGDQQFTLSQSCEAARLFCPMLIDLSAKRMVRETTWRQLSIAQDRNVVPNDEAVGYRVQIGNKQWLIYRSLIEKKSRTLLGHHLNTEFMVAQFHKKSGVKLLVETE